MAKDKDELPDIKDVKARRNELRQQGASPAAALTQAMNEAHEAVERVANQTYRRDQ